MLPNIDITVGAVANGGQGMAVRRSENERGLEMLRVSHENEKVMAKRQERAAAEAETVAARREKKPTDRVEKKAEEQDQAEINLQLTREEREAFAQAFNSREEAAEMTPEAKETAQKASERITKYVDEAIAKNRENRDRVEKAVGEWYSLLSKGEPRGATDLIQLFRQAAMGQFDEMYSAD